MSDREPGLTEAVIELADVSKCYGTNWAVRELSLTVRGGELFVFLGPNGAGKTTTLKIMTGLLRPTTGRVRVAGFDMASQADAACRYLRYVPDQPYLYDKLTGREFLEFTRDIFALSGPLGDAEQERLIQTLEMVDYIDALIETYSHGMRQRLVFAAALVHRPKVLIVDEPMVGLDPKSIRIVTNLLRESVASGTAVFMSTHSLAMAEDVADRIGILHRGRLVRCGTLQELQQNGAAGMSLEDFFLHVTAEA
jgi:ABC-2 type transport system ATP-binding protein